MTNREKLKQLLINTPTGDNDCSLCEYSYTDDKCEEYLSGIMADHLLSNNVVVLPCKIGDIVYVIDNRRPCYACTTCNEFCQLKCPFPDRLEKVVKKAIVKEILISQHTAIRILVKVPETNDILSYNLHYLSTDFDKTIFFSEEKALKECKKNDR